MLDDSYIDFSRNLQIYNNDRDKQRPVKRVMCNKDDIRLREERFIYNPIAPRNFVGGEYGLNSVFILSVIKELKLGEKEFSSCDEIIVPMIVEKAALGIIEEGKKIGKKCEAEWIAKQLMGRKNSGTREVWKCCANLYSMESFLYRKMNEAMRLIGSDEYEQIWQSKLYTFGPFCLLLWNNPFNDKSIGKVETVYRGIILSPTEIDSFKNDYSRNFKAEGSFQAFTSCTRNRTLAEIYGGNALLIMTVRYAFTVDLAPFSQYPQEEEVLVFPGVYFTVERMDFDKDKNKHLIYLNLRHKLAGGSGTPCQTNEPQASSNNKSDTRYRERMVGYDAKNKNIIGLAFLCRICSLILRDPVQLSCGHRQCKSCVESKIEGGIIKCAECQEETEKKDVLIDKGFKNDMQSLSITCSLCDWNGSLKTYENHLTKSHPNPPCEHCGKTFGSANQLDLHKLNECDKITVSCALKDYGCSSSVLRIEMSEHYRTEQHQNAIITFIHRVLSKGMSDQHEGGYGMDVDTLPHTTTSLADNTNVQFQEVSETIDVLAGGIQALNEDAQRLNNESLRLQNELDALTKDFAVLKLGIQEQTTFLDGIKPSQEILHQEVASLKQKIEDLQFVSYDGSLTWKISNFAEKMADAQSERQTSIYSPPFYSSPTGYKMRSRLYLHGDGNARRTHMSLFFVLMRSEYDAILKFPFNYKVTFCLYDQTPAQRHIIDSFRPDIKSNSFQRPRSEMNIASGIPKFFPLAMIQQEGNPYVRDDTMFIKIMVDFGDMPKTLLPYALSLNPGLPANIQQNMIKQEAEKRAQQTPTSSAT